MKELNKKRTHRDDVTDTVRLGDEGWKKRYYTQKFGDELFEEDFTSDCGGNTPEACAGCSVLLQRVRFWSWYCPFHYAHLRLI